MVAHKKCNIEPTFETFQSFVSKINSIVFAEMFEKIGSMSSVYSKLSGEQNSKSFAVDKKFQKFHCIYYKQN